MKFACMALVCGGWLLFVGCAGSKGNSGDRLNSSGVLDPVGGRFRKADAAWKPGQQDAEIHGILEVRDSREGVTEVAFLREGEKVVEVRVDAEKWYWKRFTDGSEFHGRGRIPKKWIWPRLPSVIEGRLPPKPWRMTRLSASQIQVINLETGEFILMRFEEE